MKAWFKDWFEFFTDKRFGWRFKIANFVMGDLLRNYLAVGVLLNLDNAKEHYKYEDMCVEDIDDAMKTVNELFEM